MPERSQKQRAKELHSKKDIQTVYEGKIVSVYKETLSLEDGHQVVFDLVRHPGAVAILPINEEGNLLFIRQWRRAIGSILLEIPAGTLENKEHPIDCAKRELREETGFSAGTLIPLGGFYTAPGFCNEFIHLFLAKDLSLDPLWADDTDYIDLTPLSFERALTLSRTGEIVDSKTLSALYLYQLWQNTLTKEYT